jgi:copper transport protein
LRRFVAIAVALGLGLTLAAARPAGAHAILLSTEPAPQATVPTPPDAVRLHFSESVEVAFGAVRVFDVDGHRVDRGTIRRADGGKEVDVDVPRLKDGTYTVTWRVVSADGHPVHGGFGFYVGAPSTISPATVRSETGAGRVVGWGFGIVRFLFYAAALALIGTTVVRRFVWVPALRQAGATGTAADRRFRHRADMALAAGWVLGVVTLLASFVFEAAAVSGLSLSESSRPHVVRQVLRTAYGRSSLLALALLVLAGIPVVLLRRGPRHADAWVGGLLAAVGGACVAVALSGHPRTLGHPVVGVLAVAVHLFAAATWVGGLAALVFLGGRQPTELVRPLVRRFTRVAVIAVVVVIVTGSVSSVLAFHAVSDLWRFTYGRVVLAKVVLLVVALVLAARARREKATAGFFGTAAVELAVLTAILALAAGLVVLVPGRTLALAANAAVNIERPAGPYTVQLILDPSTPGPNQVHVTFVNGQGLGAAEVQSVAVEFGPEGGPTQPIDMRLISPGHFVGDATFPAPTRYRVAVRANVGGTSPSATFTFRLARR